MTDVSDSEHPAFVGNLNNGGETNALHAVGTTVYVCDKEQELEIVADGTDGLEILRFRLEEET